MLLVPLLPLLLLLPRSNHASARACRPGRAGLAATAAQTNTKPRQSVIIEGQRLLSGSTFLVRPSNELRLSLSSGGSPIVILSGSPSFVATKARACTGVTPAAVRSSHVAALSSAIELKPASTRALSADDTPTSLRKEESRWRRTSAPAPKRSCATASLLGLPGCGPGLMVSDAVSPRPRPPD